MSRYIFIHGSVNQKDYYIPDNVLTEIKDIMLDLSSKYFTNRTIRLKVLGVDESKISKALFVRLYKGFICYTFFIDNLFSNGSSQSGNRPGQCFCITILSKNECLCCDRLYTFLDEFYIKLEILNNRTYNITTFKEAIKKLDDVIEAINGNIDNNVIGKFIKNIPNLNGSHKESTEVINFKDGGAIWDDVFEGREFYLTNTVPAITDKYKEKEQENVKLKTDNSNKLNKNMVSIKQQLKEVTAEKNKLNERNTQLEDENKNLKDGFRKDIENLYSTVNGMNERLGFSAKKVIQNLGDENTNPKKKKNLGVKTLVIFNTILTLVLTLLAIIFFFRGHTNKMVSNETDKIHREEITQHPQNVIESNEIIIDPLELKENNLSDEISDVDRISESLENIEEDVDERDERVGIGSIIE